jgi:hypothetical protein
MIRNEETNRYEDKMEYTRHIITLQLVYIFSMIVSKMSQNELNSCIWLSHYADHDVGRYAYLQHHEVPNPSSFVIPSALIARAIITDHVQQKIQYFHDRYMSDPLFDIDQERVQLESYIRSIPISTHVGAMIGRFYEHLLEEEHCRLRGAIRHLHRAAHVLRYVYNAPTIQVSTLPVPNAQQLAIGRSGLVDAVKHVLADDIALHIHQKTAYTIPSLLVMRVPAAEMGGVCESSGLLAREMSIAVYMGAMPVGSDPDLYVVDLTDLHIKSRFVSVQTQKMQLYKSSFIPVSISPSESEKQKLSDSQIATIALLCKDIARVLHFPFRMKWVLEKGNLYIIDIKKHTP